MKTKLFRSLSYSFICIILFISCNLFISNTDFVKQSVFKDEASMKIGEALDNYKYFKKTEWTEFTTKQGKEVVEFNGYYNQHDIVVRIQFIINKDRQEDANGVNLKIGFEGYKFLNQSNDESKSWSSAYEGLSLLGLSIFADSQDRSSIMDIIFENAEIRRFSEIKNPEDKKVSENSNNQSFKLDNFPLDFVEFITKFSSNADFQAAHIKYPLSNGEPEYGELEKPKLTKETWKFINKDFFFEGIRKTSIEEDLSGQFFKMTQNKIRYVMGPPNSDMGDYMIFEKLDGKWILIESNLGIEM